MRMQAYTACAVFIAAFVVAPAQAEVKFTATLDEAQEVTAPISITGARGEATLNLNDAMDRLELSLQLFGLDLDGLQTPGISDDNVTGLHIHRATAGTNGPVVFGMISPNNDSNGDLIIDPVAGTILSAWDLLEGNATTLGDELDALFDSGLYFNVHTELNRGGQIRGQILRVVSEPATWLLSLGLIVFAFGYQRRN